GARLRALVAVLFREAHLRSDRQLVERLAEDAVAMKVDFATVARFEEPVAAVPEELRHDSERWLLAPSRVALLPRVLFEDALCVAERVVDRRVEVLLVVLHVLGNDELLPRHTEID